MIHPCVAIANTGADTYPEAPYDPSEGFPECRHQEIAAAPNFVYRGVRECFRLMGLDARRFGMPDWNPLGKWIRPGMTVLVKPNLVRHFHPYGLTTDSLYTHGSVIRAVCDYALLALQGSGLVVVADAPLQTCDFDEVCRLSGVKSVVEMYEARGERVVLRDLRLIGARVHSGSWYGKVLLREELPGDPDGYTHIDLGENSLHADRDASGRYRVTCYDPDAMNAHHGGGKHQYVIANSLLHADVVLNLPKLKTHHKAGMTGALKNFIGINGHKDCLPHHIQGPTESGGDEYPRPSAWKKLDSWILDEKERVGGVMVKKGAALVHKALRAVHMRESGNQFWEGSWYGNDTISRTTVDLNRIVRFADRGGKLCATPQRPVVTLADCVIAGERDGPLAPDPHITGLLVAGDNPVAVDLLLARMIGFRWQSIPTLRHAIDQNTAHPLMDSPPDQVRAASNAAEWHGLTPDSDGPSLSFVPHKGWKGHIER